MADPFLTLYNDPSYPQKTDAVALFFRSGDHHSLRIEAPNIAVEFTDAAYIGTDPRGTLFYRDIRDLKAPRDAEVKTIKHKYKISTVDYEVSGTVKQYVVVKFYYVNENDSCAQFIAEDPTGRIVKQAKMIDFESDGEWMPLKICSTNAIISKESSNGTITMRLDVFGKKTAWQAGSIRSLQDKSFVVEGILNFKEFDNISRGVFVNYNNDRLVFYQDDFDAKNFTAYFIPFEDQAGNLHCPGGGIEFGDVNWSAV